MASTLEALQSKVKDAQDHGDPAVSIGFELASEIAAALGGGRGEWEYLWCHVLSPSELNKWGADGWQLCYGYDSRNPSGAHSQYCFFKREK